VYTTTSIDADETSEVVTFTFSETLPVTAECVLRIVYSGILNDQMRGFYASQYKDSNGVEHTMATTQFEATDCRRALPCIDEPAVKATFTVTLVCPSELTAISNMPLSSATPVEGAAHLTRHVFDPTPIMSSYLLAFCIGLFDVIEARADTPQKTLIRCFATKGKAEQNRFAMEVALKVLPFYNKSAHLIHAVESRVPACA
jgi:aminopeptidase N